MVRILGSDKFDSRGYTDENSLAKLQVTEPDMISRKQTYLYGRDYAKKFSLLSMTEGSGSVRYETNDSNEGYLYIIIDN